MGRMKEVFMQMREIGLLSDPGDLVIGSKSLTDRLISLEENGYWVQVGPMAKLRPQEFICAVYVRGKSSWVTESCKSSFENPSDAYRWGFSIVNNLKEKK
tara:strand:- start:1757 stop:2056 length:300 start_codon:yes stop_codon:yes gene_type:complete